MVCRSLCLSPLSYLEGAQCLHTQTGLSRVPGVLYFKGFLRLVLGVRQRVSLVWRWREDSHGSTLHVRYTLHAKRRGLPHNMRAGDVRCAEWELCDSICTTACCPLQLFTSPPRLKRDYPLNLSISVSGGKETKRDFLSRGDRNGKSSAHNLPGHPAWGGMLRLDVQSYPSTTRY